MSYYHPKGKEPIPNAKLILLIPRLFNVALSFLVDYILIKFCKLNSNSCRQKSAQTEEDGDNLKSDTESNNDHSIRLVTLASSQVLLVFISRTHCASLNVVLFSALLYLVSESFYRSDEYLPLLQKYKKSKNPVERAQNYKILKALNYSPVHNVIWISGILIIGLFNDPEFFLVYGSVPLFFYMQRSIGHKFVGMKFFHARCFTFLALFFTFAVPLILWDSFYFGRVSLKDFRELNLSPDSFVVTPVNYFVNKGTNFETENFIWIMLNYLTVFNVLGILGFVSFCAELYGVFFCEWKDKPQIDTHWTFLNCSLFVPLVFLLHKNSEKIYSPFDVAPLIFPLVYMHGHKLPLVSRFNTKLGAGWFISSLLGILYWGYLSDAGIVSSLLDLNHKILPLRFEDTQVDIVFSHMTLIPPTFLLAIPLQWKTRMPVENKTVLRLENWGKVRIFHAGESNLPFYHWENNVRRLIGNQNSEDKINYLILPEKVGRVAEDELSFLQLTVVKKYWNHIHISKAKYFLGFTLYEMEVKMKEMKDTNWDEVLSNAGTWRDLFMLFIDWANLFQVIFDTFTFLVVSMIFVMSYLVFLY